MLVCFLSYLIMFKSKKYVRQLHHPDDLGMKSNILPDEKPETL